MLRHTRPHSFVQLLAPSCLAHTISSIFFVCVSVFAYTHTCMCLLIKLIKLLPLTMWSFASVLASCFSLCSCSFAFSVSSYCFVCYAILSLLCLFFGLSSLCAPHAVCVCARETYVCSVCLAYMCIQPLCMLSRLACVTLYLWVCLVPLVQVVTSAFISLVWGSCSPLRSAPGQQHGRCHQTLQQTLTVMCTHVHHLVHTMSLFHSYT